ncbi:glycine--tRNA ligase subunit beta [Allosphingosinicella indica]|uniref:Glycine--tRNA ligase beta subunit n=1 Tax=Allosphingosinicella indica TaxID=941907 RepID=A0A1X7FZ18_9SPHN|nr:glycine--tRNA ligase subunit beta [Allosphingosinicella indica]SMF61309.1 glycyl-tRNA synthetase beta chain [Allosphingosinicella indica]
MTDFLLELRSEEIPARMQAKASADLARLFAERLADAGLAAEAVETWATPRRLALVARGLPLETAAVSEEVKGPRTSAPPQALEGFLRKTGLKQDQLVDRDGIWFATLDQPGRRTADVLAEAIPAIIRAFPWPKSMRWGAASVSTESLRWVRPLQGVVALLGEEIVDFEIAGIRSGAATVGHRFHHPGPITIGSAGDYAEKLRACHVILDPAERRAIIAESAARAAADAGLALVDDEGLLAENAGLTEWPVPLLGRFDPAFLDVPREVIQLTMRTNQKYFAVNDAAGALAPAFVCTANIDASDGGAAIVAGNQKVLSARLSDAKFFWENDLKVPLEEQAKKLDQIVFHEKLGTVAAKVERVAKLAEWLVQERFVRADKAEVAAAARLAKADLLTQSVGEFPELQGTLGGYLARAQGKSEAIAGAVRDHYRPAGQGDAVPADPVTLAVNIADRLDTLVAFFSIGEKPTGSRDPFALRRAALGLLQMLTKAGLRLPLGDVLVQAAVLLIVSRLGALSSVSFPDLLDEDDDEHVITAEVGTYTYRHGDHVVVRWKSSLTPNLERGKVIEEANDLAEAILDFFADRLKVQQREAGVRHDLIDAVFALGREDGAAEDDIVRMIARVKALQSFVESPQGADLLAGYKRAANILKKEEWSGQNGRNKGFSYSPLAEESDLDDALDIAEPKVAQAVKDEEFERAMTALAALRGPVDAFFDKVTVNDPDPAKREARLALLARMRKAVHRVADFSRIEG